MPETKVNQYCLYNWITEHLPFFDFCLLAYGVVKHTQKLDKKGSHKMCKDEKSCTDVTHPSSTDLDPTQISWGARLLTRNGTQHGLSGR